MLSSEVHAVRTALGLEQSGDLADWARMPGCESNAEIFERSRDALREISDAHPGGDVLVVSHGGVMAQLIGGILGIPGAVPRRFPMSNGLVVVLQWRVDAFYMLSFLDVPLVVGGRATADTSATKEN
jgi:broad specificity phosphatase PhoE